MRLRLFIAGLLMALGLTQPAFAKTISFMPTAARRGVVVFNPPSL